MTARPNIVLIITDQERSHKHWPTGWAEKNLPNHYDRLIGCKGTNNRSSVVFPNAFTATTECSPSRASLLTSSYPTEHGVKTTPGSIDPRSDLGLGVVAKSAKDDDDDDDDDDLDGNKGGRPNLLRLLSSHIQGEEVGLNGVQQGYSVAWKGKWHLSPPSLKRSISARGDDPSSILKWYGATSPWNPPDAGHSLWHASTLGGGRKFNHDGRFLRGFESRFETLLKSGGNDDHHVFEVNRNALDAEKDSDSDSTSAGDAEEEEECIFDFLANHAVSGTKQGEEQTDTTDDVRQPSSSSSQPFFLIASLVNPHDVWASSCFSNLTDEEFYKKTGYHPRDFENLPIELPPNHKDDLTTKPVIQQLLSGHPVFGDLPDNNGTQEQRQSDALRYVRFYAHLHKMVDAEIGSLLEALDATGQMDNTIIVRMADHGELALSHGLREKRMQCYEETMGIPLVINYPSGWFDASADQGTVADGDAIKTSTRSVPSLISSIDILPTVAELAGVDCSRYNYRGKSLVPILSHGQESLPNREQEVLFTFDEPLAPPGYPGYVRCIRTSGHKYAVYFTLDGKVMEYEMYNLETDPYEMANLCGPGVEPDEGWFEYHERLTVLMRKMGAIPEEFNWEEMSKPRVYNWA